MSNPAGTEVDLDAPGPKPVEIHALGRVWQVCDLTDATRITWRSLMADGLEEVAAQLRRDQATTARS